MEINVVVPREDGNESTLTSSYTALGHISKRCFILPQGKLLNHVLHHWSIYNNQKLETT